MEWYGYFDDEHCVRVKSTSFQCSSSQKSNHPCLNFLAWRKLWTLQTGFWRRNWSGGASRSNKLYKKYSTAHAVWKGGNGQWSHLFKDLLWNGSWKKHRVKISAKFQFTYPFSGMNRHSCCLKLHETPQGIMEPATGSFLLSRYGSGLGWYMKHRLFGCMSQSRGIESTAPAKFQSIFPSKMTNWKIPIHFFGSSKSIP